MKDIRLDVSAWFPPGALEKLKTNAEQLRNAPSFEDLMDAAWARQIALQLDYAARANRVICYYCTREIRPGTLLADGLPLRTIPEYHRDFLKQAKSVLSEVEARELQAEWDEYGDRPENREFLGQIVRPQVCLDRSALLQDVNGSPHSYCGGSIIYEPVFGRSVSWRLMDLGTPCVAVIVLLGSEISADLGHAALNHYYRDVRSRDRRAFRGFAFNGVAARSIRGVIDWSPHRYDADLTKDAQQKLDQAKVRHLAAL